MTLEKYINEEMLGHTQPTFIRESNSDLDVDQNKKKFDFYKNLRIKGLIFSWLGFVLESKPVLKILTFFKYSTHIL